MITKLTKDLQPGDVVKPFASPPRTISSIHTTEFKDLLRVRFKPIEIPGPNGGVAEADDVCAVLEPSALDLAVQRAQELADYYDTETGRDTVHSLRAKDLRELLDLFRAAR